jgi:hypothetical protein
MNMDTDEFSSKTFEAIPVEDEKFKFELPL